MDKNLLFYGDNLDVLRRHLTSDSIDCIYLDPPFGSNADYNILFQQHDGRRAAAQIQAFEDTWEWNELSAAAFAEVVESGGDVGRAMRAFQTLLGGSDMLAYLSMMAPRLVELERVLKPGGSLFLHCDTAASHYLKVLLDVVFGTRNFRNELIWHYFNKMQGNIHRFASNHDTIFWYTKGDGFYFQPLLEEREGGPVKMLKRRWDPATQRLVNDKDEQGRVKYIERSHKAADDVWRLSMLQPASREKLGYPTQKPEALLERILKAATREGDLVLDPFCGCGTTVAVAQRMGRRWIGIDITYLAINLIKNRLEDRYGPDVASTYRVVGEPTTEEDAAYLAANDPFQFQAWALGLVGARPGATVKKGGDRGIDGELYFHDEQGGRTKRIIISVKAGKVQPTHLRDLQGTLAREEADIGVLLTFQQPSAAVRAEAASSGFYESPLTAKRHPRMQVLTVGELLTGRLIDYPRFTGANVSIRRAGRHRPKSESLRLFDAPNTEDD